MSEPAFGATSTTDEVLDGIDLTGRVAAVTGGTGGLGLETGRALAAHGAHVVLAGRDEAKLATAAASVRGHHGDASVDTLVVDLADIASCRTAAISLLTTTDRLDLLINNAGSCARHSARPRTASRCSSASTTWATWHGRFHCSTCCRVRQRLIRRRESSTCLRQATASATSTSTTRTTHTGP